jgi:hypothetical protein
MPADPSSPPPAGQPERQALDLDEALKRDEKEDLRRRLGETQEQLEAAHAKDCPSCGAAFSKGVGAVGKKKTEEKPEKKPAEKKGKKDAAKAEDRPTPAQPAEEEGAEEEAGFGFFD